MPTPHEGESQDDFVSRCIPIVQDDGTAEYPDHAVAVFNRMRKEAKKEKMMDSETIISFGGAVKDLGSGKVAGYLVRFTSDKDLDLDGEFFTADTDFGKALESDTYYSHGVDLKIGKRTLGDGKLKKDDVGMWIESQLALRDEYEEAIYELVKLGKLGWSSGTAGHLTEREPMKDGVWIKRWPLGLDASITPTPAEPRNSVLSLKSWQADPETVITGFKNYITLAEKTQLVGKELAELLSDLRGLVDGIDKPLSDKKRKELTELLGMFSGLDAVRSDFQSVLGDSRPAAPHPSLTSSRLIRYQMAETRKRLARILEE